MEMGTGLLPRPVGEKCGVIGIYAPGEEIARQLFFGLFALQHRGQESAGIVTADGKSLYTHRDMGLVSQAFREEDLVPLEGHLGVGHVRYSTTGASAPANAQPLLGEGRLGPFAVAHNGNLVNLEYLRSLAGGAEAVVEPDSDTALIAQLLALDMGGSWEEALGRVLPHLAGAYSLAVATRDTLIGIRDPLGVRPLCIGRLKGGWAIASESCALATIGAAYEREIYPGEVVLIDERGLRSLRRKPKEGGFCLFEYVYVMRPDSLLKERSVYWARREIGRELAREYPARADLVMGIPDTATIAAQGYAEELGLPYREGFVKNRYIQRTFIQPSQRQRSQSVSLKFNPLPDVLEGKRVVVVDDSIVRGTTTGPTLDLLRKAGAKEVHLRICCPPYAHPCYLGINVATYEELIAHHLNRPQIRDHVHADTLGYLSLERLIRATGRPPSDFCVGCFTGQYPPSIMAAADGETREKICGPTGKLCGERVP